MRSDKDILARPKLLCKSNVSSNARCFVKGLQSLSSFLVGVAAPGFTQRSPLMLDRSIDAKIILITETCLIEQKLKS